MQEKKGSEESGRRLTQDQRRANASQIYLCQCGKSYLTYAALYLHVKNKHNQRLRNKDTENRHKVEEIDNKKTYTYFLKQTENNSERQQYNINQNSRNEIFRPRSHQRHISFKDQIEQFLSHQKSMQNFSQLRFAPFQLILRSFLQYLEEVEKINCDQQQTDIVEYFNQFSTYYIPKTKNNGNLSSFTFPSIVKVLFQLWKWLKKKKYSKIDLICNIDISQQTAI